MIIENRNFANFHMLSLRALRRPLQNMSTRTATTDNSTAPVQTSIIAKLTEAFAPLHLDVVNESYKHNVPTGSETHFKVTVVSSAFDNQKLIARHRLVNAALSDELKGPVHALSISAKTLVQWEKVTTPHTTPNCTGGDGSLPK